MIAKIIVDNRSKQVDKAFDYLVPEPMEKEISIGSRVIVPFSRGNSQIEGFCVGISEKSNAKKLKSILKIEDTPKAFDEDMLEVIEWMHEKYLSGYLDIIHTIVPAGTKLKGEEWLALLKEDNDLSENALKVINIIKENGGKMEKRALIKELDFDARAQIIALVNKGILKKSVKHKSAVSKKTSRYVSLTSDKAKLKAEISKIQKKAPIQAKMLELLLKNDKISTAYLKKLTSGSDSAINALLKKGFITVYEEVVKRNPVSKKNYERTEHNNPTPEQDNAIKSIEKAIDKNENEVFLLHGVTGSGKTEVFLQAIAHTVDMGKTALVLVPEISLTPQILERFVRRFGERVAILHSALSLGERYDEWERIYRGEADIVIGARSAVFAPLKNIGIIIIDEEHSDTYKSEMSPRYQTVEVAKLRAKQNNAALVLASATPSARSMYQAKCGNYNLLTMKHRFNKNSMPDIKIVDMRKELEEGNKSIFSRELFFELRNNLENKEQTILFLNRRGFSTFVSCRSCGYVPKCPNCSISLTYHSYDDLLKCHYCGYAHQNYKLCPECSSKYIRYFGGGTQKVENEIKRLFPTASVLRMDVDTTGKKEAHEQILNRFSEEKTDILIGTQMVAKGLDFENVTLVGVVSADTMLNISDYRSAERTFSMLEQVSGRAGRGKKTGRAVIQTYSPDNEAISLVKTHDYNAFYKSEIERRKLMWYPPYSDIISIQFLAPSLTLAMQSAKFFMKFLVDTDQKTQILGPIPDAVAKMKNKYRYRIIIKCEDADKFGEMLRSAEKACKEHHNYSGVSVIIDKDPNMIN